MFSDLVETTRSSETLLLSAAALANVTSVEPNAVWTVLNMGTAGCLIEAVRRNGTASSVFLQEQTATLLANMSAVPETRPHMAANRAVVALLCFLQVRHSPLQPVPEILAAERLQHKAAIALSRYKPREQGFFGSFISKSHTHIYIRKKNTKTLNE